MILNMGKVNLYLGNGYKDWLEKLREKVTKESLYHKWNTNFQNKK